MRLLLAVIVALSCAVPLQTAHAQAPVAPYGANDPGGFRNVLPPGNNGVITATQLGTFTAAGTPPPHSRDQLGMYGDLVYSSPGLAEADLARFFKDATFGAKPEDVERRYSPRPGLTVVRDKGFGTPHVYGATRGAAMFGLGYVAAEDRLFFIDVLRNLGRSRVASFAGGAPGNRAMDRAQWQIAPYTEADLEGQVEALPQLYGAAGERERTDIGDYVAGINAYIAETKLDPSRLPAEYAAISRPQGPEPWRPSDVVATASLVGGIFGRGGGGELESALLLQAAQKRFGAIRGKELHAELRQQEDPEARTSITGKAFPYQPVRAKPLKGSVALPDPGTVEFVDTGAAGGVSGRTAATSLLGDLTSRSGDMSNALLVSAKESASGKPLAVFGPQTGYFAPQILMEQDVHAPGIDARGVAFPGVNLYVQLGRGRDYAWSATAAGVDNTDTFATALCEPGGAAPTTKSGHYMFRGACEPFERLVRTNSWMQTAADMTPAGTEDYVALRSKLGIVQARALRDGRPVAFIRNRTTYGHEVDSGIGFAEWNDPDAIRGVQDFQRSANKIGYTFNWFYADAKDIGEFTSGALPQRRRGLDANLPVDARFEWKDFDPARNTSRLVPFDQHPQSVNQSVMTSWNNKVAPGVTLADDEFGRVGHRALMIDDRLRAKVAGPNQARLTDVVDVMTDAGTADYRAQYILRWGLKVVGRPTDPKLAAAVRELHSWRARGANRVDRNRDGRYEDAAAIRILDAWWPRWMEAQFGGPLGKDLFDELEDRVPQHDSTGGDHTHDAFNKGWYTYAEKDLRKLLGRRVAGWSRPLCGDGILAKCRELLRASLAEALEVPDAETYKDTVCANQRMAGDQWCFDSVRMRPLGALSHPLVHGINRPTFQQVVEVAGPRP